MKQGLGPCESLCRWGVALVKKWAEDPRETGGFCQELGEPSLPLCWRSCAAGSDVSALFITAPCPQAALEVTWRTAHTYHQTSPWTWGGGSLLGNGNTHMRVHPHAHTHTCPFPHIGTGLLVPKLQCAKIGVGE